jgi:hypothetical protein
MLPQEVQNLVAPLMRLDPSQVKVHKTKYYPREVKQSYAGNDKVVFDFICPPNRYWDCSSAEIVVKAKFTVLDQDAGDVFPSSVKIDRAVFPQWGNSIFKSSNEWVNNKSMPLHQNNDLGYHLPLNIQRALCCHSGADFKQHLSAANPNASAAIQLYTAGMPPNRRYDSNGAGFNIHRLERAGFKDWAKRQAMCTYGHFAGGAGNLSATFGNTSECEYSIPLGFYSSLVNNRTGILPLGLMASFTNGAHIVELLFSTADEIVKRELASTYNETVSVEFVDVYVNVNEYEILDTAQAGIVSAFASPERPLKLATIGYRPFAFHLPSGVPRHYLRIATNDHSVRGLIFNLYNPSPRVGEDVRNMRYDTLPWRVAKEKVTRFIAKIGSYELMQTAVENDNDPSRDHVANWFFDQYCRVHKYFSPYGLLDYDGESDVQSCVYEMMKTLGYGYSDTAGVYGTYNKRDEIRQNLCLGAVDFTNTKDTTVQSGVNLGGYGAIDLELDVRELAKRDVEYANSGAAYTGGENGTVPIGDSRSPYLPQSDNLLCVGMIAYDMDIRITPQGLVNTF